MKKLFLSLVFLAPCSAWADTKISAMTTSVTISSAAVIPFVTDPAGTPANRVITEQNLANAVAPILVSSAVAFGSSTNTVTSDQTNFSYNRTAHTVTVVPSADNTPATAFTLPSVGVNYGTWEFQSSGNLPFARIRGSNSNSNGAGSTGKKIGLWFEGDAVTGDHYQDPLLSLDFRSSLVTIRSTGTLQWADGSNSRAFGIRAPNILLQSWSLIAPNVVPSTNSFLNISSISSTTATGQWYDLFSTTNSFTGMQVMTSTAPLVLRGLTSQTCLGTSADGTVGAGTCSGGGGGASSALETLFGTARSSPTMTIRGSSDLLGSVTSSTMTISLNPLNSAITTFSSSITVNNAMQTNGPFTVAGTGVGILDLTEGTTTFGITAVDRLYANSATSSLMVINSSGTPGQVVLSTSAPTTGHMAVWSSSNSLIDGGVPGTGNGSGDAVLAGTQTWSGGNTYYGSSYFYGDIYEMNKTTKTYSGIALEVLASTNNPTAYLLNVSSDVNVRYGMQITTGGATTINNAAQITVVKVLVSSNTVLAGTTVYADGTTYLTSVKGAGLSACGDSTHAVNWNGGSFGCQAISAGGSSASTLAVTTGSVSGWSGLAISSPTSVINLSSDSFKVALKGGATAFVSLNPSSVTLQGVITAASINAVPVSTAGFYLHGDNIGAWGLTVASQTFCTTFDLSFSVITGSVTLQLNTSDPITTNLYSVGISNMDGVALASTTARSWSTALRGATPFDTFWLGSPKTLPAGQYAFCITGMATTAKLYTATNGPYHGSGPWNPDANCGTTTNGTFPTSITIPAFNPANSNGTNLAGVYFALH